MHCCTYETTLRANCSKIWLPQLFFCRPALTASSFKVQMVTAMAADNPAAHRNALHVAHIPPAALSCRAAR